MNEPNFWWFLSAISASLNVAVMGVMVLRLLTYKREGAVFKRHGSFFAWILIGASGSIVIRYAFGVYLYADPADVLINFAYCGALIAAKGNVMKLFHVDESGKRYENRV